MRKGKPTFNWRRFLKRASRDMLKDVNIREDRPDEMVAASWLGYKGASETAILALEKRLGTSLPPSYRSFLAVSDGWRNWPSPSTGRR